MTTDPHQLCLDIIQKAKSFPRECVKMKVYPYTQVFNIAEPADNPTTILEVTCLRPYTGPDKLFEVFLYGCYIPLSPLQKQEIFFALDRLYSAHEDELSREREKQNREKLQAAIQKAQNLLNS